MIPTSKKAAKRRLRGVILHSCYIGIALVSVSIIFVKYAITDVYAQNSQSLIPAPSTNSPSLEKSGDEKWLINFKDADIQSVVEQIAKITGDNYIVSSSVNGRINVVSQTPLTKSELKELLLSVLYINGFTVFPSGSSLVIAPNADAKKNSIAIDKSGHIKGAAFVARVLPIKFANMADLMQALQPLVSDFAVLKSLPDSNAILVVDKADNVQKIEQIVAELDYPETDEMESIKLRNNGVGNIMPLLEKLAPRELGASGKTSLSSIRIVGDERNNSIVLKGNPSVRARLRGLIENLDQPSGDDATIQVIPLQNSDATKIAETLKDMFSGGALAAVHAGTAGDIPVSIKANVASNAIIVHGPPEVIASIRKVVSQLDVQRTQILIEAAIVEINGDLLNQLGIQFGAGQSAFESGLIATSLPTGGSSSLAAPIVGLATYLQNNSKTNSGLLGNGITASVSSNGNFVALISALASNSSAKLLSTPSITTVNNEEAKIVVGQNVPFKTGSFDTTTATTTGTINPFTTIQRQDVGITLKVTPQINENNHIYLKVSQEVSSIEPTTVAGAADIITNKRTIDTNILALNGQTIVLGGLISDNKTQNKTKIPLLGDIPYIGWLFQSNNDETVKSDLVIFLRPTVIGNKQDAEGLAMRKYNGLWELDIGNPPPKNAALTPDTLRSNLNKLYEPELIDNAGPLPWQKGPQNTTLPWQINNK